MPQAPKFTPKAKQIWESIEGSMQVRLINNVWCSACGETSAIVDFDGRVERGLLVLKGKCMTCRGPVARVLEDA